MISSVDEETVKETVIARISNVEFFNVGQFNKYAINFFSNDDMPSSYITKSSIHNSFNRAINIYSSNFIRIQSNIVYDVKGSAVHLNEGTEIGNIFDNNLVMLLYPSLLNEDLSPGNILVKPSFY